MKKSLLDSIRFDEPYTRFELLETEQAGTPPFFARWKERRREKQDEHRTVFSALRENRARLERQYFAAENTDLILRSVRVGGTVEALVVFMNGMADETQINDFILRPLLDAHLDGVRAAQYAAYLMQNVLEMQEAERRDDWETVQTAISEGRTAVFLEGCKEAVLLDTRGYVSRSIPESKNEAVVMGPHEAFTEHLRNNVTQLRRILKMPAFVCRFREAGGQNRTKLVVAYRAGVCNPNLLAEVTRRLDAIDVDQIVSGGTIEQLIEDHTYLPMPQMLKTERPDRAAAGIMQGKVVLLVEGSPLACVLPVTLGTLLSSAEDTYMRQPVGTLVRLVRIVGALLSILMPAFFLALALHHQGQLSSEVLATVTASRVMVYMPLPVEMIFLLLVFQLVREAGLRVPGSIGHAVGIIGGLVLGQAAVAANIVSTVVLIIVALSGLGNFTIPDYSTQVCVVYYRILLCVAATMGGLLGIGAALLLTIAVLSSVKSFGVPFFAPLAPVTMHKASLFVRGKVQNHRRVTDYMNPEVHP